MSNLLRVEQTHIANVYANQADPSGFVDKTATLSFVDGTLTFTITGAHEIYINGLKYAKTTDSKVIANSVGLHYIYYNASTVLSESTVHPGFYLPLVATIYWDGSKGVLAEERHGINMPGATHAYLHETVGARYISGLAGTFTNTTFSIATGSFIDEDIIHTFLTPLTQCQVFYKNGTANFTFDTAQAAPYKAVTGIIQYNNVNALANVTNNSYVAYWVFATNDINTPIMCLMGQREDVNITNARLNNTYSTLAFSQIPYQEAKLLYRVIYRNLAGTPTYIEAEDYRTISNLPSGTYVATDHNTLSNVQLAGNGVTFGHITDQAQDIYGTKTLTADGTVKSTISFLTLRNTAQSGDMISTGTALHFMQAASDSVLYDSGKIVVSTETQWTSTAADRDSKMVFQVSENGNLGNALILASTKYATFTNGVSANSFRAEGSTVATGGTGLEVRHNPATESYLTSYDRTNSLLLPLYVQGSPVHINLSSLAVKEITFINNGAGSISMQLDSLNNYYQTLIEFKKSGTMNWQIASRNQLDAPNDRLSLYYYDGTYHQIAYFYPNKYMMIFGAYDTAPTLTNNEEWAIWMDSSHTLKFTYKTGGATTTKSIDLT